LTIVRKRRAPAEVAPWQAYSKLFVTKGTKLYAEIHGDYENFKSGDESTRSKYSALFSDPDETAMPIVAPLRFYQTVLTDRLKDVNEEDMAAVQKYIKDRHDLEMNIHRRPWDGLPGLENEPEIVKKRKYLRQ
jgi:hypothetical protein